MPNPNDNDPDDGFDPEDLDFTQYDEVEDLGEGRYLIKTDGPMATANEAITEAGVEETDDDRDIPSVYAIHANIVADENQREIEVTSDDVVTAFDHLLSEYAETVSSDMPVEDTLSLLFKESKYSDLL